MAPLLFAYCCWDHRPGDVTRAEHLAGLRSVNGLAGNMGYPSDECNESLIETVKVFAQTCPGVFKSSYCMIIQDE
jgi:hypothetical protein